LYQALGIADTVLASRNIGSSQRLLNRKYCFFPCEYNQQTHWVPTLLLVFRLYMFRAGFLPIIRSFLAVQRHWYILCNSVSVCYREQEGTILLPVAHASPNCIKRTNAVVRLRNSLWWAESLPETCRVEIPIINLELSASVGFFHKKSITMHGHTILKFVVSFSRESLHYVFLSLHRAYWRFTYYHIPKNALIILFII
jgi:hypothetical protein